MNDKKKRKYDLFSRTIGLSVLLLFLFLLLRKSARPDIYIYSYFYVKILLAVLLSSVLFITLSYLPDNKYRKLLHNFTVILVINTLVIATLAGVCELLIRSYPDFFWGRNKNPLTYAHPMRGPLNKEGFRDINHSYEKPHGRKRIILLGDSWTYGADVPFKSIYHQVLLEILEKKSENPPPEIISFTYGGWNTLKEYQVYKKEFNKFKHDILMIGFVLNDAERKTYGNAIQYNIHPKVDEFLRKRSHFYFFILQRVNDALVKANIHMSNLEYILSNFKEDSEDWKTCLKAASAINELCDENNIKKYIIIFPIITNIKPYPFKKIHEQVYKTFYSMGWKVLDLQDVFKGMDTEKLKLSPVDGHPNIKAHRIMAERISDWIIENKKDFY